MNWWQYDLPPGYKNKTRGIYLNSTIHISKREKYTVHIRNDTGIENKRGWEINMINVTKMNNVNITINDDLIEVIEETPDTVITLTTGKKLIVKETREEIVDLVKKYKRELYRPEN